MQNHSQPTEPLRPLQHHITPANMLFHVAALTAVFGFVAGAVADGTPISIATSPAIPFMLIE